MWTSFSACAKMNTFSSALKDDSSICTVLPGTVVSCRRTLLVHFVLSGHNVHKKHLKSLFTFCHSNPSKGELQWCAEAQWKQCGISVSIVSGLSSSHSGTVDVDSWGKEEEILVQVWQSWWQFGSCITHLRADTGHTFTNWDVDRQQMHSQRSHTCNSKHFLSITQTQLQGHALHTVYYHQKFSTLHEWIMSALYSPDQS